MILKGYLFSILYVLLCVGLAVIVGRLGVPKKYTRKIIHILVGFVWVILYHYMGAGSVHFLAVCLLFLVLLTVDYKFKLLPAMSSDGDNAPGTVYYALAMSVMAAVTLYAPDMILPFGVGVFCTSLGDGFAAVIGQLVTKGNPKIWGEKTLYGTLTSFAFCLLVPIVFNAIFDMGISFWHSLLIAFFAFEIELFIGNGLDNIAITLGSAGLTHALIFMPNSINYIVPIIVTPLIIAFAHKRHALTRGGIIAAIFLDLVISFTLRNFGFTVLITFFVGSVAVDKIKKHYKKKKNKVEVDREKRGDCRDVVQVVANGAVAALAAILAFATRERAFVLAFVAALAESFADTAASGIGFFSKRVYDPFRFEKCENGVSGGMSPIGTLASLLASASVALVAFAFGALSLVELLLVTACAFFGAVFDSFLGSIFQIKYKCIKCKQIVEKEQHCGEKTEKYRGFSFISNDVVNLLSTLFSAALALVIALV